MAHRSFCTEKFFTEKLLHRGVFTQRGLYTKQLLDTENFTQRSLHREVLARRKFVTLQHRSCTSVLNVWPSRCAKRVASEILKSKFKHSFLRFHLHFVRKGCIWFFNIQFYTSFSTFPFDVVTSQFCTSFCPFIFIVWERVASDLSKKKIQQLREIATPHRKVFAFHQFVRPTRTIPAEGHVSMDEVWPPLPPKANKKLRTWEVGVL